MARFEEGMEAMVDAFVFETTDLLQNLDDILMRTEQAGVFDEDSINEIFRAMHTIKGSAAMMGLNNMSTLAHAIEDMFFIIREQKPVIADMRALFTLVFNATDLLKAELEASQDETTEPTDFTEVINKIEDYVKVLKGEADAASAASDAPVSPSAEEAAASSGDASASDMTTVKVFFEDDCKMENLRAMMLIGTIKDDCKKITYEPADIETNPDTCKAIIENGFIIHFTAHDDNNAAIYQMIENALNVKSYEVLSEATVAPAQVENPAQPVSVQSASNPALEPSADLNQQNAAGISLDDVNKHIAQSQVQPAAAAGQQHPGNKAGGNSKQSLISVNLNKLDQLMDMVGEIVITEAMVTASPDLRGLQLDRFQASARQLRKLTDEMQDIVMSIRMVPLSGVFNKMTRIVRDMKVKLNKEVNLVFEGAETEVDKSIIDNLNDPLMHMVRNSVDHGIEENAEDRIAAGKPAVGTVKLSAYNSSNEVYIIVSDDGAGINTEKVLDKAERNGILTKPRNQYTDKEAANLIMLAGFSTNEVVTEYSGRGVGMDVVRSSIEKLGGSVSVESKLGEGSNFIIKIPLSLSIVDGMEITVGSSIFTIPINSIRDSFKLQDVKLFRDTQGGEMIMLRGDSLPLIRLYELYGLEPRFTDLSEGIILRVEADGQSVCLFADELIGESQVVVKPFSPLLNNYNIKQCGMSGCTVLGDGSITIILDVHNIIQSC